MASLKDDNINFDKLESGVHQAMEAENLYWLKNDAKFRAVKQKGSYEEFKIGIPYFRDIVAAAHLKPLAKNDKIQLEEKIVSPWNTAAAASQSTSTILKQSNISHKDFKMPSTSHEFALQWRKLKDTPTRAQYLENILASKDGSTQLATIFKNEIPFGLLGELIKCVSAESGYFDCIVLSGLLKSLTQTGRFVLALTFLSSDERDCLRSTINHLEHSGIDCSALKVEYDIK